MKNPRDSFNYSEETLDRARRLYKIFINERRYETGQTMTYKQGAQKLGCHHRAMRYVLHKIQDECNFKGWPTITVLIVDGDTGLPSTGCDASGPKAFVSTLESIKNVKWPAEAWWD